MERILSKLPQPQAPDRILQDPEKNYINFLAYKRRVVDWHTKLNKLANARKLNDEDSTELARLNENIEGLLLAIDSDLELINSGEQPRFYVQHELIMISGNQEVSLEELRAKPGRYANKSFVLTAGEQKIPVLHFSSTRSKPMHCAFCESFPITSKQDMRKHIELTHVALNEFEDKSFSSNRSRNDQKPENFPPVIVTLARLTQSKDASLSAEIADAYECLKPKIEEHQFKERVWKQVETIIKREMPYARLYMYGSSANGFSIGNSNVLTQSDIDLNIMINFQTELSNSPANYQALGEQFDSITLEILSTKIVYSKACEALKKSGIKSIKYISQARIHLLKFETPDDLNYKLSVDICLNNQMALANTELLLTYSKIDFRVPVLGVVIKAWAKNRRIADPKNGTLSSYAYLLLMIHYLQRRDTPLLPCLQKKYGKIESVMVANFDTYFTRDITHYQQKAALVKDSLGELLLGFFRYYAYFNWDENVISIRLPEHYQFKTQLRRQNFMIEDPFQLTRNLSDVVQPKGASRIKNEFKVAANKLARTGSLAEIMKVDP